MINSEKVKQCTGTFTCRFKFALLIAAVLLIGGVVGAYFYLSQGN